MFGSCKAPNTNGVTFETLLRIFQNYYYYLYLLLLSFNIRTFRAFRSHSISDGIPTSSSTSDASRHPRDQRRIPPAAAGRDTQTTSVHAKMTAKMGSERPVSTAGHTCDSPVKSTHYILYSPSFFATWFRIMVHPSWGGKRKDVTPSSHYGRWRLD